MSTAEEHDFSLAEMRGRRSDIENMSLVPTTTAAMIFSPGKNHRKVPLSLHMALDDIIETRPAGTALELVL